MIIAILCVIVALTLIQVVSWMRVIRCIDECIDILESDERRK